MELPLLGLAEDLVDGKREPCPTLWIVGRERVRRVDWSCRDD
jgi:hypothetical protein